MPYGQFIFKNRDTGARKPKAAGPAATRRSRSWQKPDNEADKRGLKGGTMTGQEMI